MNSNWVSLQGSRKHYCVHRAARAANLEEECDKMLAEGGCAYFKGTNRLFGLQTSTLQVRF